MTIYHITDTAKWEAALNSGTYRHPSFQTEGFIHCSTAEQLQKTLAKHFKNETEVVILTIVDRRVRHNLKWDTIEGGEIFPHIYGNIPVDAVEDQQIWLKNAKGEWEKA